MSNDESKKEKIVSLDVGSDGVIRTIYKDELNDFAKRIGGEISTVCRASNVEWERLEKPASERNPQLTGWSVRAAHDPQLAIRVQTIPHHQTKTAKDVAVCSRDTSLPIMLFSTREGAIEAEIHNFFKLLPPRKQKE